jgi:hypothetical protein
MIMRIDNTINARIPIATVRDNDIVGRSVTVTEVLRPAFCFVLLKSVTTSLNFSGANRILVFYL